MVYLQYQTNQTLSLDNLPQRMTPPGNRFMAPLHGIMFKHVLIYSKSMLSSSLPTLRFPWSLWHSNKTPSAMFQLSKKMPSLSLAVLHWSPFLTWFYSLFPYRFDSVYPTIFHSCCMHLFLIPVTPFYSHCGQDSGSPTYTRVSWWKFNGKIMKYSKILKTQIVFGKDTHNISKSQERKVRGKGENPYNLCQTSERIWTKLS